jgi:hypothetical protein
MKHKLVQLGTVITTNVDRLLSSPFFSTDPVKICLVALQPSLPFYICRPVTYVKETYNLLLTLKSCTAYYF